MATNINVNINVKTKGTTQGVQGLTTVGKSAKSAAVNVDFLKKSLLKVVAATALAGAAFYSLSETYTRVANRLRIVTKNTESLASVQRTVANLAKETRTSYGATAEVFARVSIAVKNLGVTTKQTSDFVKATNQTIAITGATAREAEAGLIQFSQGLASNRLAGDELKSVLEGIPRLGIAIARGLGISFGKLRELGAAQKLTARAVFDAILRQKDVIDREFKTIGIPISQALTNVSTNILELVSSFDGFFGVTPKISAAILFIGQNLDILAAAFLVAATAAAAYTASVIAAKVATLAFGPIIFKLTGAFAAFAAVAASPFVAIPTLVAGAAAAVLLLSRRFKVVGDTFQALSDTIKQRGIFQFLLDSTVGWADEILNIGKIVLAGIGTIFTGFAGAFVGGIVSAGAEVKLWIDGFGISLSRWAGNTSRAAKLGADAFTDSISEGFSNVGVGARQFQNDMADNLDSLAELQQQSEDYAERILRINKELTAVDKRKEQLDLLRTANSQLQVQLYRSQLSKEEQFIIKGMNKLRDSIVKNSKASLGNDKDTVAELEKAREGLRDQFRLREKLRNTGRRKKDDDQGFQSQIDAALQLREQLLPILAIKNGQIEAEKQISFLLGNNQIDVEESNQLLRKSKQLTADRLNPISEITRQLNEQIRIEGAIKNERKGLRLEIQAENEARRLGRALTDTELKTLRDKQAELQAIFTQRERISSAQERSEAITKRLKKNAEDLAKLNKKKLDNAQKTVRALFPIEAAVKKLKLQQEQINLLEEKGLITKEKAADALERSARALDGAIAPVATSLSLLREKIRLQRLSSGERDEQTALKSLQDDLLKSGVVFNDLDTQTQDYFKSLNKELLALEGQREIIKDFGEEINKSIIRSIETATQSFAEFIVKGTSGAKSFSDVLADLGVQLANIALKRAVLGPLTSFLGIGAQAVRPTAIPLPDDSGAFLPNANGNLFTKQGLVSISENDRPEAVLPLRRGSDGKLGVVSSGGGGGTVIHAPVTVQVTNNGATSDAEAEQQGQIAGDAASNTLKRMMRGELVSQQRPGGVLNQGTNI